MTTLDRATTAPTPVKGRTVVAPRAVVAIAGQAATEIDGVELVSRSGVRRLLADLWPGAGPDGASAQVGQGVTAVELHLAVSWPRPVVEVAAATRAHVQDRVGELTGYTVTEVDIVVDALPPAGGGRTGRVS
ncbi:MAG: Asp23/Gls24 family envelope stress response protein [Actinobacteria bacterium]|nr:Asp23/Gls24 family envelope stress response protein [Actinomycetota bacterium]